MGNGQNFDQLLARKRELELRVAQNPELDSRMRELRSWQAQRLEQTYAALRSEPRYAPALEFFLSDLYGPGDSMRRDEDLRRALIPLKRALPAALLDILCRALELQILTAELDQEMVSRLGSGAITDASYAEAYRLVGRAEERKHQIELIVRTGEDLSRVVRKNWIALALRAAHLPAQAAGFGVLQSFLERGFGAFRQMEDARDLLATIQQRETVLMESLLRGDESAIADITQRTTAHV
jgi:hypothetical protein